MTHPHDLTTGNISQHLLRLAAPLIMGNILQQLYNTVDAFILGRFAGSLEFAAVGVAGSVMNLFLFMITGACSGISVIYARFYGADDLAAFRREHWISLSFGILTTALCSAVGFLCLPYLLQLIHTPEELTALVSNYLKIILISLPAAFLYNLYSALLRAIGQTTAALLALTAAVMINVLLDFGFVAVLHLGITGAAIATAASQMISAVLCIIYLCRNAPELIFRRTDCRIDTALLRQTAHFSVVTALYQSSLYIGKLLVQGAVNTGGTAMISAYTATTRIEGFANSFCDSGCSAASVFTAQNYGAEKTDRVHACFRRTLSLMLALGVLMSVLMYVSAPAAVGLMLGEYSGEAFVNACAYMRLISFFYIFCFTASTFSGHFTGIGKVSVPLIGAAGQITVRVIFSWLWVKQMGLSAVAAATGIGWILLDILYSIVKHKTKTA